MVLDPFSITGIVIIVILLSFAHRILSFLLKVLVWALLIAFLLVLLFDITWSDVLQWLMRFVLWVW